MNIMLITGIIVKNLLLPFEKDLQNMYPDAARFPRRTEAPQVLPGIDPSGNATEHHRKTLRCRIDHPHRIQVLSG